MAHSNTEKQSDKLLGNSAKLWQSSLMMIRLMNVFTTECDIKTIKQQNDALRSLRMVDPVSRSFRNPFAQPIAVESFPDNAHLSNVCTRVEKAHADNHKKHDPFDWYRAHDPEIDDPYPVADWMHSFELTVFGYLRQQKLSWNMPEGIKTLIFHFHGNFVMDTFILTPDHAICLGFILRDKLSKQ